MAQTGGVGNGYTWDKLGDEYAFAWEAHDVTIDVAKIREDRGGHLICELSPAQLTGSGLLAPLIAPTTVNLSSSQGKNNAVKALARWHFEGLDWATVIETVAGIVLREYREGEPWIDLGSVEWEEEIDWHIYPFLPRDEMVVLYGDGESGKSMWAAYLAYCVRTGRAPIHSEHTPEPGNVLYLDYETHSSKMQARRFGRIANGFGEQMPEGIWRRQCFRPIYEEAAHLRAQIAKRDVKLVIIDSLAWAAAGDINEASTAIHTQNAIRQLGCSVIVIAHISHHQKDNAGRRQIAGSVFFENGPRLTWEVRSTKNNGNVHQTIWQRKVNEGETMGEPLGQKITFPDGEGLPILFEEERVVIQKDNGFPLRKRIRDYLLKSGKPQTVAEIADALEDAKDKTVRTTLGRMEDIVEFKKYGGSNVSRFGIKAPEASPDAREQPELPCPECQDNPYGYDDQGEPRCMAHFRERAS